MGKMSQLHAETAMDRAEEARNEADYLGMVVEDMKSRAERAERALAIWIAVATIEGSRVPADLIAWSHGMLKPGGPSAIDHARSVIAGRADERWRARP